MFKLNNRGWGLGMFLAFIGIFFLAIVMIIVVSRQYDLGLVENVDNSVTPNDKVKYVNYEKAVKEASAVYSSKILTNIQNGDIFYVDINNLDVSDTIKSTCDGYSKIVKKDGTILHYAYIKCGNYSTSGYNYSVVE